MALAAVGQLGINLIRQNDDVLIPQQRRDGFQVLPAHHGPRGIAREREDDELCARRDGRLQLLRRQLKAVFSFQRQRHGHAARQRGDGVIADKARLRDDDFVAGVHQRADAHIDGLGAAHGNDGLPGRVGKAHAAGKVIAGLLPQLRQARIARVPGAPFFQAADARVAHRPGRFKIRLAHAQRDAVLHLGRNVKKFADARGTHVARGGGNDLCIIHHSSSRSSVGSRPYSTPSFL